MFDELYRKSGVLKIPTYYSDGKSQYTDYRCNYFRIEVSVRDEANAIQSATQFYCKPSSCDFPETALTSSVFVDENGRSWEIKKAGRIFDHFANQFETLILTAA